MECKMRDGCPWQCLFPKRGNLVITQLARKRYKYCTMTQSVSPSEHAQLPLFLHAPGLTTRVPFCSVTSNPKMPKIQIQTQTNHAPITHASKRFHFKCPLIWYCTDENRPNKSHLSFPRNRPSILGLASFPSSLQRFHSLLFPASNYELLLAFRWSSACCCCCCCC